MLHRGVTGNPGRHPFDARGDDLYETPACATRALLANDDVPLDVWEPACGRGAIASVLQKAGRRVLASDLSYYGYPGALSGADFLLEWKAPAGIGAIVTNPPYKLAAAFVRKALDLRVPKVIMLLRLAFLEGAGRSDILDGGQLARVLLFSRRLPRMHRDGWNGPRASSSICFAWFVWEHGRRGPTEVRRIDWERELGAGRSSGLR